MITFKDDAQNEHMEELRDREAEEFAQALSAQTGTPYIDLSRVSINTDALGLVPEELSKSVQAAAFSFKGEKVNLAVVSPTHPRLPEVIEAIKQAGHETLIYVASPASVRRALSRYNEISHASVSKGGQIDVADKLIGDFSSQIKTSQDLETFLAKNSTDQSTTSALLEIIIAGALALRASDVHIEPEENNVGMRFRLDGILTALGKIDHHLYRLLASRIKLISALKLNITSARQDGRFSIKLKNTAIEVRTSIIPGAYGESIVLRILDPAAIRVPFESLGMSPLLLKIMEEELDQPNGMIITTGPTGSGKTTTLYASLRKVNKPGIKIITIEDPIEYHLEGITQTQTNSARGYTFNEGLKSAMRQDPDVIMVGEIRDGETAKTAIDAALTGHLVFSTLHTNNASGAIPRLIDLGVDPKVIGPALNITLAQRLVRILCEKCKYFEPPTDEEKKKVEIIRKEIVDRKIEIPAFTQIGRPKGCAVCNNAGYKGRIGIFEAILVDQKVEEAITKNPSEYDIAKASEDQKILTMTQDGIVKVIAGVTTIEELERVVSLREK